MTFHIVSALVAAAELSIYSDVFGNCSSRALGLGSPLGGASEAPEFSTPSAGSAKRILGLL